MKKTLRVPGKLILLVLLPLVLAQAQALRFDRETIEIAIQGSDCIVTGEYFFENRSIQPITNFSLFYPFPATPEMPFPDSIIVKDARTWATIPYGRAGNGIIFKIGIPARGKGAYLVQYHQPAPAYQFEYILSTTRQWNQPLSQAVFKVRIPKVCRLLHLSMDYDSIVEEDGEMIYSIYRHNFMPDTNLIIQWRPDDDEG